MRISCSGSPEGWRVFINDHAVGEFEAEEAAAARRAARIATVLRSCGLDVAGPGNPERATPVARP